MFHSNLVVVSAYDGQNCLNSGESFPPSRQDRFYSNRCIITGCTGSKRTDHHGQCEEQIGHFNCDASSPEALQKSMENSWQLHDNEYYTPSGNASLPCGISVEDAAIGGGGVERNSRGYSLPTDIELVAMARALLMMSIGEDDIFIEAWI